MANVHDAAVPLPNRLAILKDTEAAYDEVIEAGWYALRVSYICTNEENVIYSRTDLCNMFVREIAKKGKELAIKMKTAAANNEATSKEVLLALKANLAELTNLNADTHTSALRDQMISEKFTQVTDVNSSNAHSLNTVPFVIPAVEGVGGVEQYLLPPEDSEIGEVMRKLLMDMRNQRNPRNKITLKQMKSGDYDTETCDGTCVEVVQEKCGHEYLHENVSRSGNANAIYRYIML